MVSVNQVKHFFLVKNVLDSEVLSVFTDESADGVPTADDSKVYFTDESGVEGVFTVSSGTWTVATTGGPYLLETGEVATYDSGWSTAAPQVGDYQVVETVDGKIMIKYFGKGGWIKSDYIDPAQVLYAKTKVAADMKKALKKAIVTLPSSVNGGVPVAGEDYIIDITVSNYIALGDNNTLLKFAAAYAPTGMTAQQLVDALADSLKKNLKRDVNKFFSVTSSADAFGDGTNVPGIIIEELPQTADYVRGEIPVTTVNFAVNPHTVICNGDEVEGMEVRYEASSTTVPNSYDIADQEFFCAGERGDQYRQVGYPRSIRTKYLIDTDNMPADGYDTLDIAFYWVGRNHAIQKSEKHILCVGEGSGSSLNTPISGLKSAINAIAANLVD